MAAYYNEIEPYAAAWLRNLIQRGLIADGEVDTRSIVDVSADDLVGFTQCHFFAGIGGWSHALRLAGWPDDRPVWTGSCPCQPFSVAGKGLGADDPRHLWPHFHRLIAAVRPPVVFGEQVAGAAGYGWLDGVRSDLAGEDYSCEAFDIPACAVDAPHIRSRLYWVASDVADSDGSGRADERIARLQRQHVHDADGRGERDSRLDRANDARLEGQPGDVACAAQGRGEPRRSAAATGVRGDMADADCSEPRAGRSHHAEVRGVSVAQRGAEDGSAVSARGGAADGDMADAEGVSEREPHNDECALARQDARAGAGGRGGGHASRNGTFWSDAIWLTGADGKSRRAQPGLSLLVAGVSGGVALVRPGKDGADETHVYSRTGALRAFGNAIVPQLAAEVISAFMEARP
jgi:DNA (cytosine-5)-methyltransferase 1